MRNKLSLGKVLSIFVGVKDEAVEEKVEEIREERQVREEDRNKTHSEEMQKRQKGKRLVAGVNVRDMTEEEFLRLIDSDGGDD